METKSLKEGGIRIGCRLLLSNSVYFDPIFSRSVNYHAFFRPSIIHYRLEYEEPCILILYSGLAGIQVFMILLFRIIKTFRIKKIYGINQFGTNVTICWKTNSRAAVTTRLNRNG